ELLRALHLNAAHVTARERALQIGIAPRQARHPPIGILVFRSGLLRGNSCVGRMLRVRGDHEPDREREARKGSDERSMRHADRTSSERYGNRGIRPRIDRLVWGTHTHSSRAEPFEGVW